MSRGASPEYSIGLDVGTQGTKAIVYDTTKHIVVGRGSVGYGVESTRAGQAEQDPELWREASGPSLAGLCLPPPPPPQQLLRP